MDDLAEHNEHDGCDDAGGSCCESAEEGEDGDGESNPACVDTERSEKDGKRKQVHAPVRKSANIQCEAEMTFAGRAT